LRAIKIQPVKQRTLKKQRDGQPPFWGCSLKGIINTKMTATLEELNIVLEINTPHHADGF